VRIEPNDLVMTCEEIIPPLPSGERFAAKVLRLFVTDESGRHEYKAIWPECTGHTEEEAKDKLRAYMHQWAGEQ
jgi:hypothetical protein